MSVYNSKLTLKGYRTFLLNTVKSVWKDSKKEIIFILLVQLFVYSLYSITFFIDHSNQDLHKFFHHIVHLMTGKGEGLLIPESNISTLLFSVAALIDNSSHLIIILFVAEKIINKAKVGISLNARDFQKVDFSEHNYLVEKGREAQVIHWLEKKFANHENDGISFNVGDIQQAFGKEVTKDWSIKIQYEKNKMCFIAKRLEHRVLDVIRTVQFSLHASNVIWDNFVVPNFTVIKKKRYEVSMDQNEIKVDWWYLQEQKEFMIVRISSPGEQTPMKKYRRQIDQHLVGKVNIPSKDLIGKKYEHLRELVESVY